APKITMMMARMMSSSGKPMRPMMWLPLKLEALIVPLFAALAGAAQYSSGVNLVEVYATVTDAKGNPIEGLTAADFRVKEDGVAQAIAAFTAGDVPLSVVVALDRSFSMAGERLALAKRAASAFISALRPEDEVSIVAVGSETEVITPPGPAPPGPPG